MKIKKMSWILNYKQTILLLSINIAIFIFSSLISTFIPFFNLIFSLWPIQSESISLYQFFSYQFFHFDIKHLFFNMMFFVPLSIALENRFKNINIIKFYVIFGIISGLFHLAMSLNSTSPLIGSSGSVWGFIALYIVAIDNKSISISFQKLFLATMFFLEIYSAILHIDSNTSHWCHIGGAITGTISYFFIKKN